MKFFPTLLCGLLLLSSVACEESSTIGSSTLQDQIDVVVDSSYTVSGHSVINARVQSRTTHQLLGVIDAKGFGNLKSDIVTQFMPAASIDTSYVTINDIDSVKLILNIHNGSYIGDSIVPMGLNVYRLNKQLPSPIYSDFNPADYYSEDGLLGSVVYTANALGESDSVAKLKYRSIKIDLPIEFGQELFTKYKENPDIFLTPSHFADFFPGIYISNTYGSGRVINIDNTLIKMYYHKTMPIEGSENDTTYYKEGNYLAVSPEIITNNNITYAMADELTAMSQNGENIIVAPIGMDVELTFPTREIINSYNANQGELSVINSLSFEIPAEKITNDYNITPPPYLLLVKTSYKDEFFAKGDITNNAESFYAAYNAATHSYIFSDMRAYILDMIEKNEITDEDINFTLTPVSISTENYSSYDETVYINSIVPYVQTPVMVRLRLDNAKIKFTYSKQTTAFD